MISFPVTGWYKMALLEDKMMDDEYYLAHVKTEEIMGYSDGG